MAIRISTDLTGTYQTSWHVRQALKVDFASTGWSTPSNKSRTLTIISSKASSTKNSRKTSLDPILEHSEDLQIQTALNKIIIPKEFNREELQKIKNLNKASASCQVLGLKRNTYQQVFLKAAQITP
jgi:hypothetical protein